MNILLFLIVVAVVLMAYGLTRIKPDNYPANATAISASVMARIYIKKITKSVPIYET